MGSLPNLQALCNDPTLTYKHGLREPEDLPKRDQVPAIAAFNSQHYVDRNRIDQQEVERRFNQLISENRGGFNNQSGKYSKYHKRIRQTRSTGSQQNPCLVGPAWDDYLLELQMATTSPLSSRSSRSNVMFAVNQGSNRRRDSLSSSGGTSSVRRLIAVVRSTPSRLGPVYSRRVLCRNFAALCLGHVTITAALLPMLSLQSSVSTWWWSEDSPPGALLLAGTFLLAGVSCLFSPYLVHLLGCNWTLVIGYIGVSLFFVAHLYPILRWLVPAYFVLGLCLGPLFSARTTYITTLATKFTYVMTEEEELQEVMHGDVRETLLNRLTRGLQMAQDLGMVLGNLVAWSFLHFSSWEERKETLFDESMGEWICGAEACPTTMLSTLSEISAGKNSTWDGSPVVPCRTTAMLTSVFVGCGLVSVALTAAFTDKIRLFMYQDPLERPAGIAMFQALRSSFRDTRLQLAAPLSVFIGLQQGFMYADFSKWYVVCSLGVPYVSLVFVSMASLQAIAAFTLSLLMQHVPRPLVIVAGLVFHACLLLVLLLWKPAGDDSALLYVIAAAWGVCNAIWECLNFTILLHVQSDSTWQTAFIHGYFFRCIGLALAFGVHDTTCISFKLYAIAVTLLLAVAPHTWLELKMDPRHRKHGLPSFHSPRMEPSGSSEDEDFPGRLLHQAALWDNCELLEDLLHGDQRAYINSPDKLGRTPLHAAASNNKSKCLQLLLISGADPNARCGIKGELRTALHRSAESGFVSNVRTLLQYGASLVDRDKTGLTALDLAERGLHEDCVTLLQHSANERETRRQQHHAKLREACVARDLLLAKNILTELGPDAELIANMAPNGANTLLFLTSESCEENLVSLLLSHGADGRVHPVTKYSPLYIACYNGHLPIVRTLLVHFPELVRVPTVERWLPVHASVIGGHLAVLELLLSFHYPPHLLDTYWDPAGEWEYELPFDINVRDATGQSVLYLACVLGNFKLVQCLLQFQVKATRAGGSTLDSPTSVVEQPVQPPSPAKKRIADGIQSIMSRLNLKSRPEGMAKREREKTVCPLDLNQPCGETLETPLQVAVREKQMEVVTLLLQMGANPNISAQRGLRGQSDLDTCASCLMEACKNHDVSMVELLLRHGARDDLSRAQSIAVRNSDLVLTAKLLACKAIVDPEFKLNKKAMTEQLPRGSLAGLASLTYSSVFPNVPVMINWHGKGCQLDSIKANWLIDAALHLNPKLKLNPKNHEVSLYAITRLDISSNSLSRIPIVAFQLPSLRHMNLSQNKLEKLPSDGTYNLPVLEELCLQNNRLESLPDALLSLPCLTTVDVSNNKLTHLPPNLWTAPALKEFNAAFNLLRDLPTISEVNMSQIHRGLPVMSDPPTPGDFPDDSNFGVNRSPSRARNIQMKEVKHQNLWSDQIELTEQIVADDSDETSSRLIILNLAHNLFTSIPPVLACLAVSLTRLNMSYNNLRSMSHITTFPASLKQLDLSSNHITVWPSLPQVDTVDEHIVCYSADAERATTPLPRVSGSGLRNIVLHSLCTHRRHVKLDNLRTLVLSDNALERIQLATDEDEDSEWDMLTVQSRNVRSRLMFPNLSMLDISNNKIREIPHSINELSNLSVFNLAGNCELNELPPQLGLLSRLWNLNTQGCNLQEPLRSMIQNNKYKTMDVIGYLKSVLEDAKAYARIKLMIVGVQGIGKTSLLDQLRQEGSSYRRRPQDHWAKRMGNKHINVKTARGTNISTVGVDIGVWVYDKKGRASDGKGPVIFRTWDFGGQKEYYATHQYFLSKRSLYLVTWKIPDGERGLREVRQWLVNIQARAPNSPVIIVGTHYDEMSENHLLARSEDLQQVVRERFINIVDAEKCGLPRVLDTIEVSCRTRHNIRLLCNLIYDTVYSLRPPGSKDLLLEQRVPATYLALEDVVTQIASERRSRGVDPVLNSEQFRTIVATEMQFRFRKSFRDLSELHQATIFLHENGVLLHYEDATLRDLYFLDPQWLCDMLAHVVTVREINPFARTGIMKMSDLQLVFKSSGIGSMESRGYIVSLLNKFEVALTWDNSSLLIPSLLPTEEDLHNPHAYDAVRVKIPVRSRAWAFRNKKLTLSAASSLAAGITRSLEAPEATLSTRGAPEKAIRRLLLMSYFPSGFWSRLMTRVLADDAVVDIVRSFLGTPKEAQTDVKLAQCLDQCSEWLLWQTGMELRYGVVPLFQLREAPFAYRHTRLRLLQDGVWCDADLSSSCLLEMYFPLESVIVHRPNEPEIVLKPSPEAVARLLALAVDHVDTLLEDWYPTLGTRFVHTSEGKFLVTRLVPCPLCIVEAGPPEEGWVDPPEPRRIRQSTDSAASMDSGVGHESQECSVSSPEPPVYSWMVEDCILSACEGKKMVCPTHGEAELANIAPDTIFTDLGDRHLVKGEDITRGVLLGRGAFGFVFRGTCRAKGSNQTLDVAMKMLQPVPPGRGATQSAVVAYKVAKGKWDREPLQYACKAYCTARQELNILLSLRHPHIVPLVGVCTRPLALVLDLAPQGALDVTLKAYRRSGAQFTPPVLQQIVLQVAKALEYLHQQRIIYRDLKSENVLVWSLPPPFKDPIEPALVKLADYGISRQSLTSGSKGFGGTEGFMAPEMVRYNGEEEYTEKVDCFSFGMFLYELLTLHQPFEGHEAVKECVLEGGRPPLTPRGTHYPTCILDLMVLCWNQVPKDRPSASQIVSMAASPEFVQLLDCAAIDFDAFDGAESRNELWLIGGRGAQVLQANTLGWTGIAAVSSPVATAIALIGSDMWLGDAEGNLHVYSTLDFQLSWNYALGDAAVRAILSLPTLSRVAIGLANGRLFIVHANGAPTTVTMAEGSFIFTELGNSEHLTSLTCVERPGSVEIWVGESEGYVSIYTLTGEVVTGHDQVNHFNPVINEVEGVYLHDGAGNSGSAVLSHVSPGCVVYLWDTTSRQISATLDCTKLVPCSESLKPLTLEDLADKCQITSVCHTADCVYIGTAWGCIVVAELATLYPVSVFRPFEAAVSVARPLGNGLLGLVGKGYRSLAARNTDMVVTPTSSACPVKSLTTHVLLWKHST